MKKSNILFICLLFVSATNYSLAQVDQKTALHAIGDGSIFKGFWGIETTGGKTTGQARSTQYEIKFENDIPDRDYDFTLYNAGTTKAKINSCFGFLEPNHHTKPSAFCYSGKKSGYIYINGILYFLKGISDPTNIESFEIDEMYVLWKPANATEDLSGKSALKDMKTRDHDATIKEYLSQMKEIQEKATANFTDKEKDEIAIIEQAKIDKKAGIEAKNAAYWNSPEGQRVLKQSRQPDVTLFNDTGATLLICYGSGVSSEIEPGESEKFSCTGSSVYRGTPREGNSSQHDRTDNVLLERDGTNCGGTVNASTVIR